MKNAVHIAATIAAAAFLLTGNGAARADTPGALVIVGGGLADDNAAIWSAIVTAAGGPGSAIAVIPAASAEPEQSGAAAATVLARFGAVPFIVPLAATDSGAFGPRTASDPVWAGRVAEAGGVHFTGGAQARIVAALQSGGAETPLLRAVRAMHARGGVIAGTSAGAAVMSAVMFTDPAGPADLLLRGARTPEDIGPGLAFLGHGWMVDQHFLVRERHERAFAGLCAARLRRLAGIDEDTALVVRGDMATVVGRSGVMVLETRRRRHCAPFPPARAHVHLLFDGDRLDLKTGRATPAQNGAVAIPAEAAQAIAARALSGGLASVREAGDVRWSFVFRHTRATTVTDGQTVTHAQMAVEVQRPSR